MANLDIFNPKRARELSKVGDVNTLIYLVKNGAIDELSEVEQRAIVSQAFIKTAKRQDELASRGIYPKVTFEDNQMAIAVANFSSRQRSRALEITWNPEGEPLKDQLEHIFDEK